MRGGEGEKIRTFGDGEVMRLQTGDDFWREREGKVVEPVEWVWKRGERREKEEETVFCRLSPQEGLEQVKGEGRK